VGADSNLETDYLVVGAGAIGMAFVDTLIEHSDAEVVMVDRRHRPGGHWLDSYPFVQLHQPSMNYGVNSTRLGQDRVEADGRDTGFLERATGTEICGYFEEVMSHRLLASGRVRFLPMCDYLGDRRVHSRISGETTDVTVRRRVVDATYMASRVPATDPPPFEVADGVRCVPVGELTKVVEPPAGYVVVGGGKTALDAACWLLDQGTAPERIMWIRPRDPWLLNRAYFQPGPGVVGSFEGVVREIEAVADGGSVEEIYERLEAEGVMLRMDPAVTPGVMRGATLSVGELAQLRRVENVIRLGHVTRVDAEEIVLEEGSVPTPTDHLFVHCAARGLRDNPPKPVFGDDAITLQVAVRASLPLSGALIAFLEASDRTVEEKNRMCPPNPWPHTPFDFLRWVLTGFRTELAWGDVPDVQAFIDASRLNLVRDLPEAPDRDAVVALQGRLLTALMPALDHLDALAASATPAEQARIYTPA
jgi:hypothetical protein